MSIPDANTEAKTITALDHQSGKGAEAAAAALNKDYNEYLKENGNDVAGAKKWLQDTTAALASSGVLPDITIGVLHNETAHLSSDGKTITGQDIQRDNFLLGGSTGAQQSFDGVFTDQLANDANGLTDAVNKGLGSKDGSYSTDQFNKFDAQQTTANQTSDNQNSNRQTDAGLFKTIPGTNISVLQYVDGATGSTPDGNISSHDIQAALANPLLPQDAKTSLQALQDQMNQNGWSNRSINDILKQDGIAVPSGTADVHQDPQSFFAAANKAFDDANTAFNTTTKGS